MSNVLVTGDRGFLGRHLCNKLSKMGFSIYKSNTSQANLMEYDSLNIFRNVQFDYIFHLAAKTKAGDYCLYHSGDQWIYNQTINTNILRFWKEKQPHSKMIAMGTSCSYDSSLSLSESNYLLGEPESSLYTYAMTKRMLLNGLQSLSKQYGMNYTYFIPSTIYGANYDKDDNHFIFDIIRKIKNGSKGEEVELWGDGSQKRELIHVDDVISIMIDLMSLDDFIVNVGTGESYSIKYYVELVSKFFNYESDKIIYNENKYVGAKDKKLDIGKLRSVYKKEFVTLEEGLKQICM